jgi:hypothetical protein
LYLKLSFCKRVENMVLWDLLGRLRQQYNCWEAAVQLPPELAGHHGNSQ